MGTDTKAFFPNVKREQVIKILKMWDPTKIKVKPSGDADSVYFNYKGEDRMLHLSNEAYFTTSRDIGLPNNTNGVWSSFGAYGKAVEIVKMICYIVGGYIMERDIEDKPFYKVNKNPRKLIKVIFQ